MTYIVKTELPCERCGTPTGARVGKRKRPQCFDCSLVAAAESAIQISNKSGPYYERWRANIKAAMEKSE
jgi:hypothetical protein